MPLPQGAFPGQTVHLIVLAAEIGGIPSAVPGVVVAPAPGRDPLAFEAMPGLVAVPADSAVAAAAAVAEGRIAVILGE